VPARVGQTILDVALQNKVDLEGPCGGGGSPTEVRRTENWVEYTYGEGPNCFFCHVQIPSTFDHLLPEITKHESDGLQEVWEDEVTVRSRLACMIKLDKKHDGMVVFVPDAPPTDLV
jgi:ferredoxin